MKRLFILITFAVSVCDQSGQNKLLLEFRDYETKVGFVPNSVTIYELDTHRTVYQYRPDKGQMNIKLSLPNGRYTIEVHDELDQNEARHVQVSSKRQTAELGKNNNHDIFSGHHFIKVHFKVMNNKWGLIDDNNDGINGSILSAWKRHQKVIRLEPKSLDSPIRHLTDFESQYLKTGYSMQVGYISDDDTGEMLENVKVVFQSNQNKVVGYTNKQGFYKIYFPTHYVGYRFESYEKEGYGKKTFKYEFIRDESLNLSSHTLKYGSNDLYEEDNVAVANNTDLLTSQHTLKQQTLISQYSLLFTDSKEEEKSHPLVVKVGFSDTGGTCGGHIRCTQVRKFHVYDEYLPVVIASEIYAAFWVNMDYANSNSVKSVPIGFLSGENTFSTETMNMMKALAVAAYSYMQWHKKFSNFRTPSGERYDICSNTACQAFLLNKYNQFSVAHKDRFAEVMSAINGYVLTYHNQIAKAEYSSEPNNLTCYDSPNEHIREDCPCATQNGATDIYNKRSADGYVGANTTQYPCVFDRASVGHNQKGHHRGMSLYGAFRWATGKNIAQKDTQQSVENRIVLFDALQRKHWVEILAFYYNASGWKLVKDRNLTWAEGGIESL